MINGDFNTNKMDFSPTTTVQFVKTVHSNFPHIFKSKVTTIRFLNCVLCQIFLHSIFHTSRTYPVAEKPTHKRDESL